MVGRRKSPDGLPFRLYKRIGKFKVSYGYKLPNNTFAFRLSASVHDADGLINIRKEAIQRAEVLNGHAPTAGTTEALIAKYFKWQYSLPLTSESRKAVATLRENEYEKKWLIKVFGQTKPAHIKPSHIYKYLRMRASAGAPAKANKEIALLSAVLEYGRGEDALETNPCVNITYNKTRPREKCVNWCDLEYAMKEARNRGGSYQILALCALTAYLTVGRPTEMRELKRQSITDKGVRIKVGKRKAGETQRYKLIEWTPELRAVITEALQLQRTTSILVFGNTAGQVYSRSGWNTIWTRLMKYCEDKAAKEGKEFIRFALADMRPTAITKRMEEGDEATARGDASGHADARMVQQVYDRRRVRRAKATSLGETFD